jgi:membrane protein DedA with SNARE-associated domain
MMEIPQASMAVLLLEITLDGVIELFLDVIEWLIGQVQEIFHGYSSVLRWGVDSARSLFESYGYWVIFFGTLFENTLLLGLIIPGALVIILAGLSAQDGTMSVPIAIAVGAAGTVIGDTISYCLGRFGWRRFGSAALFRDVEKVREPILRRGTLFVLVYHFAGYTRVVGPTAAGFLKMPYAKWAPADYLGGMLWVTVYLGIGYGLGIAGLDLDSTDKWFRFVEWGLLVAVMLWGFYLYRVGQRTWQAHQDSLKQEEAVGIGAE